MKYIPTVDSQFELDDEQTISNLLKLGMQSLVETQCETILSELLNLSPFDLYKYLNMPINEEIAKLYWLKVSLLAISSLNNNSKLNIIDSINFCGNQFILDENVLTPHLQTQEITYATIGFINELFEKNQSLYALDMCCGSGVIGLSIKKAINKINMTSADISEEAINILKLNAQKLDVLIDPIKSDMFSQINGKYDIITANPPYLPNIDNIPPKIHKMINEGKNNIIWFQGTLNGEPPLAILSEENGLKYYHQIIENLNIYLKEKGMAVLEFGGKNQQQDIHNIIQNNLSDIETYYLYSSKDTSPRAAFIFRGISQNEIEEAKPKVLKLIPNIQTSIGEKRFNIKKPSINKY